MCVVCCVLWCVCVCVRERACVRVHSLSSSVAWVRGEVVAIISGSALGDELRYREPFVMIVYDVVGVTHRVLM